MIARRIVHRVADLPSRLSAASQHLLIKFVYTVLLVTSDGVQWLISPRLFIKDNLETSSQLSLTHCRNRIELLYGVKPTELLSVGVVGWLVLLQLDYPTQPGCHLSST